MKLENDEQLLATWADVPVQCIAIDDDGTVTLFAEATTVERPELEYLAANVRVENGCLVSATALVWLRGMDELPDEIAVPPCHSFKEMVRVPEVCTALAAVRTDIRDARLENFVLTD